MKYIKCGRLLFFVFLELGISLWLVGYIFLYRDLRKPLRQGLEVSEPGPISGYDKQLVLRVVVFKKIRSGLLLFDAYKLDDSSFRT